MPAPAFTPPGEGTTYEVLGGDVITIKATGTETDGQYTLFETTVPPGMGPIRHVHHREDESFYVLSGRFEFHVGEQTYVAEPGAYLFGPRGVPHQFRNTSEDAGKLLIFIQPAGFEQFIAEFATLPVDQPPDPEQITAIASRYGVEFV